MPPAFGAIVGNDLIPLGGLGQRWGDPDVEALKFAVNAGIDLSDTLEAYGFATYMDNTTTSDFFYRGRWSHRCSPTASPRARRCRSTTTRRRRTACRTVPIRRRSRWSTTSSLGRGGDPNDYLVADATSPSGFVLRNPIYTEFPGGYNPDFGADLTDMSFVLGLKGDLTDTLTWDLSGRYAENEVEYTLSDTINPSLGRLSPLSFKPGTLTQEESGINLDFVKSFAELAAQRRLRRGVPQRDLQDRGRRRGVDGRRSHGGDLRRRLRRLPGVPPESAGSFESDSWAGYVDVETDLTDRLSGAVALRYEDYDEFGDTTDWKVSGRYQFTDAFAIRATANTGFRAPTPGRSTRSTSRRPRNSSGNLIPNGTYPSIIRSRSRSARCP